MWERRRRERDSRDQRGESSDKTTRRVRLTMTKMRETVGLRRTGAGRVGSKESCRKVESRESHGTFFAASISPLPSLSHLPLSLDERCSVQLRLLPLAEQHPRLPLPSRLADSLTRRVFLSISRLSPIGLPFVSLESAHRSSRSETSEGNNSWLV